MAKVLWVFFSSNGGGWQWLVASYWDQWLKFCCCCLLFVVVVVVYLFIF